MALPEAIEPTTAAGTPFYFLSFSTGEPQIEFFVECLEFVFSKHYQLLRTPSVLESGNSQHDVILDKIAKCLFGIVCLDGLRPNVVFEYGAMRGAGRPVLLFKENSATVDIAHFFTSVAGLALPVPPAIDMDKQFSNTKDKYYVGWSRLEIKGTIKKIWDAYAHLRGENKALAEIPEPKI